jgi:hypothetical protein
MAEIDEFLASLEDDEEQEQQKPEVDPKKLGYALRQEQKAKKQMAKELEELKAFRDDAMAKERKSALQTAGLNEFHSEAYLKFYPDVSEENLTAYKARAGLEAAPTEEAPAPAPPTGFSPTSGGEPLGAKVWDFADWQKLMKEDPEKGRAIADAGRVNWTYKAPPNITQ